RPITGGFASVYHMRCGMRDYAVRCFLREYSDHQTRYDAISRHLAAARLPYAVRFEFIKEGIRVGSRRYPILKMEWIRGETLTEYVKKNLRNHAILTGLASQW